eukprot:CAMPEP_0201513508 /NCGR_PEP_ID=MMETSP0161_2-20130828/5549_1 /ASSEMBLY_ACC=CAM_ASM_000251 /TAXON_ID=180227 /ORGANISM="Neoparamoeba aestuarina, Strain SoJaBio B1-5/56/2" /LENGTH=440 /DNA_ID=CAMNT_0047909749 /DNA_START=32 /DNA_END=1354 /DNA_ORIENTATION=+
MAVERSQSTPRLSSPRFSRRTSGDPGEELPSCPSSPVVPFSPPPQYPTLTGILGLRRSSERDTEWKDCWFNREGDVLCYYNSQNELQHIGAIELRKISKIQTFRKRKEKNFFSSEEEIQWMIDVIVNEPEKAVYSLLVKNEKECTKWVKGLKLWRRFFVEEYRRALGQSNVPISSSEGESDDSILKFNASAPLFSNLSSPTRGLRSPRADSRNTRPSPPQRQFSVTLPGRALVPQNLDEEFAEVEDRQRGGSLDLTRPPKRGGSQKKARKMGKKQAGGFPTSGEEEWLESGQERGDLPRASSPLGLGSTECDVNEREKELENELKVKERLILKLKLQIRNERTEAKEREAALTSQFDRCFRKFFLATAKSMLLELEAEGIHCWMDGEGLFKESQARGITMETTEGYLAEKMKELRLLWKTRQTKPTSSPSLDLHTGYTSE